MAKFQVTLARLVRETKTITVEAASEDEIDTAALYEKDDGTDFEPDMEWGADEGTHSIIKREDEAPEKVSDS